MTRNPLETFGSLLPDEELFSDKDDAEGDEPKDESKTKDSKVEDKEPDSELTAKLTALEQKYALLEKAQSTVNETLKRETGRIQSLTDRLETKDDSSLRTELQAEFGAIYETLSAISDQEILALPTDLRDKLRVAADKAGKEAQASSLDQNIKEQLQAALKVALPQDPAQGQVADAAPGAADVASQLQLQLNALQSQLESAIRARGLDPDDDVFDWAAANTKLKAGGYARTAFDEVNKDFVEALDKATDADDADGRRQKAKEGAKTSPDPTGGSRSDEDKLNEGTLEERIARLRKLGAI